MIYKWNEISIDMFLEILNRFWEQEDWSKNLILEVQNIKSILYPETNKNFRIYFGNKIDLYNFKEDNKYLASFLNASKEILGEHDPIFETKLSMCILKNNKVNIVPVIDINIILSIVGITTFDNNYIPKIDKDKENNDISILPELWYIKDKNGNRFLDTNKNSIDKYDNNQKVVRIRTIDYSDWNDIVNDYKTGKELRGSENDLNKTDIKLLPI